MPDTESPHHQPVSCLISSMPFLTVARAPRCNSSHTEPILPQLFTKVGVFPIIEHYCIKSWGGARPGRLRKVSCDRPLQNGPLRIGKGYIAVPTDKGSLAEALSLP
eukprot:1147347-Pelagomonas_calceolata.AAC.5